MRGNASEVVLAWIEEAGKGSDQRRKLLYAPSEN